MVRGRGEAHADLIRRHLDAAWGGEEVGDDLLGLGRLGQVRRDDRCEVRLDVGADDADGVDHRLQLAGVTDEPAGQFAVLDGDLRWDDRPDHLEHGATFDGVAELGLELGPPLLVEAVGGESVASVAFLATREAQRAIDPPSEGVRDDRAVGVGLDLAAVELVDAPPLDAVLEAVLLPPPEPQDLDEPDRRSTRRQSVGHVQIHFFAVAFLQGARS